MTYKNTNFVLLISLWVYIIFGNLFKNCWVMNSNQAILQVKLQLARTFLIKKRKRNSVKHVGN